MDESLLLAVWSRLVSELALQQDKSPKEFPRQVANPICGKTYLLDTACAAKVFATEYRRTKNQIWFTRTKDALTSVPNHELFSGLHEPIWDVLGWHEKPKSLAATGIAVDALWDSNDLLGINFEEKHYETLLAFLGECFHGRGRFAHNAVKPRQDPADVQNTTAAALYLLEYISKKAAGLKHPLLSERKKSIRHLGNGQEKSGFWPYLYPGWRVKSTFAPSIFKKIPGIRRFFSYNNFGDMMHQAMTLYFLAKYFSLAQNHKEALIVSRGWRWIKEHFINGEKGLAIDWSWEPVPALPEYCNFRDTNSYFWILGLLPSLESLGVINKDESTTVADGIINYINNNLLEKDGKVPCVIPHEGPPEVLRNILPMFEQGVAWKGSFLADVIRQNF